MSYDINEFPGLNGQVTGCIKHVHDALQRHITDERVRGHLLNVLSDALGLNERAFAVVQAHRYGEFIPYNKNGAVACHNTLAT